MADHGAMGRRETSSGQRECDEVVPTVRVVGCGHDIRSVADADNAGDRHCGCREVACREVAEEKWRLVLYGHDAMGR